MVCMGSFRTPGYSEITPGRFLECHFPSRKRPWLRRSILRTGKRSSTAEVPVLEPAKGLQRLFNHLHETSTTYTLAQ